MHDIRTAEIADGIFQFATHLTEVDFGLNQYLVTGDEPLLFHTGMRWMHTDLAAAVSAIVPLETLRWVSFGHVEADECGALNQWLAAAPHASPTYPAATPVSIVVADEADDPAHSLTPSSAAQLRALATLEPATLAPMHGPAQQGDGARSLASLADLLEHRLTATEVT